MELGRLGIGKEEEEEEEEEDVFKEDLPSQLTMLG